MSNFELFQESPGLFFIILLISLVLTLFVYGAFPVIFAKTRKKPITKKKYRILCYGINFAGIVFFVALNGAAAGGPYILWTWVFSKYGIKTLESKGLLIDVVSVKNAAPTQKYNEVSPSSDNIPVESTVKIQLSDPSPSPSNPHSNWHIYADDVLLKTENTPNADVSPTGTINVSTAPPPPRVQFCRKCGNKLEVNHRFCGECGTKVYKNNNQ